MPTLFDQRDRDAVLRRLRSLTPEHQRRWGRMTAPQMLCHVSDQLRVALGDLPTRPMSGGARGLVTRIYAIHTPFPWPRGKVRTSPEMLTAKPTSWDGDVETCAALIGRFAVERPRAVHPAFGALTPREWGILAARHLDHHFTQFGV